MKIITDEKKVSRNKKIGTITTIGSLVILGVGLYMSFKPELMNYSFGALLLGFAFTGWHILWFKVGQVSATG